MKWHKGYSGCFGYENWRTRNNDDVMEVFFFCFFLNLLLKELFSTSFVYKYKTYMPKWQTQMICWSVWCIVWTKFCFDVSLKAKIDFFSFMYLSTQLCHIDCQAEGGIPSYSFALMVIFFLQQRKDPILPVYLGPWVSYWERATLYLCSLANNQP